MPNTFDLIRTQTLGSSATAIDITLPSGYSDVQINFSIRSDRAGQTADGAAVFLNGDYTAANYRRSTLYDENGTIGGESNYNGPQFGVAPGASVTSGVFLCGSMYIPNYALTGRKIIRTYSAFQMPSNTTRYLWQNYMNWSGTSAITTVRLISANAANYIAGSEITIYGIAK